MALFTHKNEGKGEIRCVGCGQEITPISVTKGLDNSLNIVVPVHVCPPYEVEDDGKTALGVSERARLSRRGKLP